MISYEKDGAAIYERSFAIIRSEASLARFTTEEERIAVRLIHASGMVDLAPNIVFSRNAAIVGIEALERGAPILCDTQMVAHGITRARLPANNAVICTLDDPSVALLAKENKTTRSAAAMELWRQHLQGSVVAVGNAPTALFRLLELIDLGCPKPALVIGVPVGFVGAIESKEILRERHDVAYITVSGRRGGSALAAAAVNAIARSAE